MEKFRHTANIVVICLVAVVLLVSSAQAKPASVQLQEGLYAEEIEGDLDAAIKIYEEIAADKSADSRYAAQAMYRLGLCYQKKQDYQSAKVTFEQLIARFPKEKTIIEKVQLLLDQLSAQDPAALMPPETLVYLEFGSPGKQIETIVNMLKDTPFANPLAVLNAKQGVQVGIGPAGALASLMNPSMMAEFKKIRGIAIGFQGINRGGGNPPLVAAIYPGESDALRGILLAALGMVLQPGEPVEGMQTLRMGDVGGAAYDDNVIILVAPTGRLIWCAKQYKGFTSEPTLLSQNKAFAKLSRKQREQNAVTIWGDVDRVFPLIREEMPEDQRRLIETIGDIGNVDEITTSLSLEKDGYAVETNVGFKDGHSCLAYDLIRTPNITKAGFEAVPAEAVALVSFALGEAEGTGAASARKALKKLTGLDIGRELFANIEQITLFALPPTPTPTKNVLAESISPVVPCLGLAVTSRNPKRTEQLVTQLLTLTDLVMGISKGEELAEQRSPAVGEYKIGVFNGKPAYCYVGQAGKSTVLTLSPEVLQASLSAVESKTSASSAGPLREVLSQLLPDTSKLAAVNFAGAIQLANVHICASRGISPDPQKNYFSQLLGEYAQACTQTYVVVRTDEKANNFGLNVNVSGLPDFGRVFPLVAQLPAAMQNPMIAATKPTPADKAMVKPAKAVELHWEPGGGATAHKVYFGTSIDDLSLLGEVSRPSYDKLPAPERGVTYYWRVDELRADGSIVTGDIWSFGTGKLVAWWKLDGDTKDSSGQDSHGTVKGNPKWVTGRIDRALEFDGVDDYVDLAIAGPLGNSPRTVCAWARTNSASAQYILSYGEHSNRAGATFRVGLSAWGGCEGVTVDVSYGAATYAAKVADGSWHHYSFVVPDKEDVRVGDVRVYQDGRLLADTCGPHNLHQVLDTKAANPINIGRHIEGTHYFNGAIDEVRVLNYALSQEEILELCATTVATLPEPVNRAVVKPGADVKLGWRPGKDAIAHKVYFGTNTNDLSFLADVKTPSYDRLPKPERGVTCYWRVDEVQADGSVVTGDIWSFSTGKLVAWWKFDETSGGTAADSSGNNYHGTKVHFDPVWKPDGKFGGCLYFNETYGFSIPKEVFGGIDRAITISVWVKGDKDQQPHSNVILQAGVGKRGKPYLVSVQTDWQEGGEVRFITGHEGRDRVIFNAALDEWAGRWNHYAFVKDADEGFQRIYCNGRLVAEQTGMTALMAGVDAARIGIAPDRFGDQYIGKLDDLRIYNYALSAEEIQQLRAVGAGVGPAVVPGGPAPQAPPIASYPVASYLKGLVGHWKFDEGSGSIARDSARNYDGTLKGVKWTTGRLGTALEFDGHPEHGVYLQGSVGDSSLLNLGTRNLTISSWVKIRGKGGTIVARARPKVTLYRLGATKKAYIDFGSGKQRWGLQTDPILQPDTWHHIVGVFDRSQKRARLYVDGRERATGALTTRSSSGIGESTTIGRWFSGGPGPSFEGVIDEVMIFNRPLSTEEIRQLYAAVGGFGPVAEVELGDIDESPQAALVDFDTGTLVKIPDHLRAAGEAEVFPWVTERGLDVGAEFAGDEYGLFGIDVVATKIAPDQWDKITPAELHKALAAEPIGVDRDEREIMMSAKGEHPPTFAFRTREGGTGVLQVVDADRSKKTIRLRYKMLQGEPGPQRGYDVSAVLGKWRIRPTETSGDVQWIQFFDNGIMIRHEGKGDFMHRYELRDDTIVLDDGNFFVALLDESTLAISETGNAKEALVFDRVGPQMRTVLLPEDSHVLDLATGRLYEIPHEEYEETEEILAYFRRLGKGDLGYDDKVLCTVRGAKIQLMEG
ncbi:MAG: LamG-like jellyroll fold domain-containing protein, partial [Planctomycetota bacterium]